ncbi:hypothetical protein BOSEA31B_15157 [Hyphomicrobiales bacterium]|nr:hypothetical protein BOSEA31B_15157 [Hyphomicrobiales bacterium]CAH1701648.1 hypothetical protein BOSEA1005_21347 [Hyphomicrobiales bacterium]CAI0345814.1 hypothetical protein BO1005MUT1_450042 [Hyphomicrobiales bacterium]
MRDAPVRLHLQQRGAGALDRRRVGVGIGAGGGLEAVLRRRAPGPACRFLEKERADSGIVFSLDQRSREHHAAGADGETEERSRSPATGAGPALGPAADRNDFAVTGMCRYGNLTDAQHRATPTYACPPVRRLFCVIYVSLRFNVFAEVRAANAWNA